MAREFWRKIIHMGVGAALITLAVSLEQMYSLDLVKNTLFLILILSLIADFLIADIGIKIPIYRHVQRTKELKGFHSSTHFLLGTLVALHFYPFDIALAAISMLVFGDALAALVGKRWGTPFYRKKTLHGSLAMLVTSILAGLIFINSIPLVITMALVATTVEVFITHVDDNLMIPIFTGLVGTLLQLFVF